VLLEEAGFVEAEDARESPVRRSQAHRTPPASSG